MWAVAFFLVSLNASLEHHRLYYETKSRITLFEKDLAALLCDLPMDLHFTQEEIQIL